jgi:hypothetical protein
MKRFATILSISFFILLTSSGVYAQLFLKGGLGYGLGVQKLLLGDDYTASSDKNIYGSFGGNWGFYLGGGYAVNKYVDLGLDLGYQNGRFVMVGSGLYSKNFTGRLIYFNPSLTYKTLVENTFSPYAKVGILTGLPLMKVTTGNLDNKFRGGIPLGVNEALGINFNASDNLNFFVELYHQSMIYKPTKRKDADGTLVRFKDQLPYPAPNNEEMAHHFFSFGALGLNLGIKFVL